MFKFSFDLDDTDIDNEIDSFLKQAGNAQLQGDSPSGDNYEENQQRSPNEHGCLVELSMEHLLNTLPTNLSFSFLEIPLSSSSSASSASSISSFANGSRVHHLARRDLFDARFQVISEDKGDPDVVAEGGRKTERNELIEASSDSKLRFLDTPSDLVPGVYEGGLKTWECSLDLVDYLHASLDDENLIGKRVLELGCGTGVPSLYLLQRIFSSPPTGSTSQKTIIHFQDYNPSVLELVTFPNMLLSWYMSPASEPFLSSLSAPSDPEAEDAVEYPAKDPTTAGDLPITSLLKIAFKQSLERYNVEVKFLGGSWKSFRNAITTSGGPSDTQTNQVTVKGLGMYDILLTSETIYRTESMPDLIHAMWEATHPTVRSPSEQLSRLMISEPRPPLILVAAKVFYFGVGGGVDEFVEAVKKWNGVPDVNAEVTTIWERNIGVRRRILRVFW
ncbi:hypothetical protein GGU10DRAFT_22214 [Lentinula aff. detonsa]|uniref:protein-histidine N-methyltransferase n=1 Tax=Lentinula aff. detonsa TaxID=2804958 RepID=A0AA38KZ17_9AGAR|nr:hypothetical protein GGU10DRAFT_22214 [Lentinula aff. detonsa]